jgi:hypothetical protein
VVAIAAIKEEGLMMPTEERLQLVRLDSGLSTELDTRKGQRDKLAAWFTARPWQEVTSDDLERLIGHNFMQRLSECRTELGMTIENLPQWLQDGSGRKIQRLAGHYVYRPQSAQGRAAHEFTQQPRLIP